MSQIWGEIFNDQQLTDHSTISWKLDTAVHPEADLADVSEITITSQSLGSETWILPSRAFLIVKARIRKSDGTVILAGSNDDNGAANNHSGNKTMLNGWSPFRRVEAYINGVLVDFVDNPSLVDTLLTLIEGYDENSTLGSSEFTYLDTNNTGLILADDYANSLTQNKAQAARLARTNLGDSYFYYKLRLNSVLGMMRVDRPLRGCTFQLKLSVENNHNFSIFGVNGKDNTGAAVSVSAKPVLSKIVMHMPTIKPHNVIFNQVNKDLLSGKPLLFDYRRIWTNITESKNGPDVEYTIMSNARRPRIILVGIVDNTAYTSQIVNPFIFSNCDGIRGHVKVGNQMFPATEYNSDLDNYLLMYNNFLALNGKDQDRSTSSFLTFERFKNLYPIVAFNCEYSDNNFELQQDSRIELRLYLTNPPANYRVNVMVLSDEHKQIVEQSSSLVISNVEPKNPVY